MTTSPTDIYLKRVRIHGTTESNRQPLEDYSRAFQDQMSVILKQRNLVVGRSKRLEDYHKRKREQKAPISYEGVPGNGQQ